MQWQALSEQTSPVLQLCPQAPQLLKSLAVLAQVEPQQVCFAVQLVEPHRHLPPAQVSLVAQVVLQPPQWSGSFCTLAQPELQQVSPGEQIWPAQAQAPPEQVSGVVQALPQVPQLALSLVRSWQAVLPQQTAGAVQLLRPHEQVPSLEHMAELPLTQQTGLEPVQAPAVPHLQTPATHDSPGLQAVPQAPQWNASLMRSMQPVPAQQVWPVTQAEPLPQRH